MIEFIEQAKLPTRWGLFDIHGFWDDEAKKEHIALTLGDMSNQPIIARVHSECLTGDALFSLRCDCGSQLEGAMKKIADEGAGVILYLRQEGRGIGLLNKIKAYNLQDQGSDTVEANAQLGFGADLRVYDVCKSMLEHLKIKRIKLMTNNPKKLDAMRELGIDVVERVEHYLGENSHNTGYLDTKVKKMGHLSQKIT